KICFQVKDGIRDDLVTGVQTCALPVLPFHSIQLEWKGMEWNGMEWNGINPNRMEWNGMERNGMEWNGMEWNGINPTAGEWNGMRSEERRVGKVGGGGRRSGGEGKSEHI